MKIEIENKNKTIISAFHVHKSKLSLSLYINTEEKGVQPYREEQSNAGYIKFYFNGGNNKYLPPDSVTFSAETDEEHTIITGIMFTCHEKDQLWYLFPAWKVYGE